VHSESTNMEWNDRRLTILIVGDGDGVDIMRFGRDFKISLCADD